MDILEWAATAKRGEEFVYGIGDLATTRYDDSVSTMYKRQMTLEEKAFILAGRHAWYLYGQGDVTLVQRRVRPYEFQYIAQKL